jgi:hypothetical protein
MKHPVLERDRTRAALTPVSERRKPGLRCVSCGSVRCEVTAGHHDIAFRCLDCASQWTDRRTTARLGPDSAPASEATHAAVLAICRAIDGAAVAQVTLDWLQRLTRADRVTFVSVSSQSCTYLDLGGSRGQIAIAAAELQPAIPRDAQLTCELDADLAISGRLVNARSAVFVPVNLPNPIGALAAYWTSRSAPTVGHLQTMQLLAEAVASRLASVKA